jgi:carbamoyl-phosphate synthase large subunit
MDELLEAAGDLGYPMVVRPSFTMGGLGSGMAYDEADLRRIGGDGLHYSPTSEVLLEESILGWKEFELELMRDGADNCVVICSIENVDPVGVHTGDSVTVAPALTLTDVEMQKLRDLGIAIIREVGVDTGGCNVQFATHPETGRVVVIEMNPRVSRSSALASKATGFPIAKIAARVAIGYTLDEIRNDITGTTPASFEPALDYVVVKVPRFAFEKFPAADPTLTTTMKSVGEAMALGRNFTEALGKAQRSIDAKGATLDYRGAPPTAAEVTTLLDEVRTPTAERLVSIARILWSAAEGILDPTETLDRLVEATAIDRWFLDQMLIVAELAAEIRASEVLDAELLGLAKRHGLSDEQIGALSGRSGDVVKGVREALGINPVYKTVDTCAAEFASRTPYHYSTYDQETEIEPREKPAVLIPTASARASSSTTPACTPRSPSATRSCPAAATRPS